MTKFKNQKQIENKIILSIYSYSKRTNFKSGLNQETLFHILSQDYPSLNFEEILNNLERKNIIYKLWRYHYPHWYLSEKSINLAEKLNLTQIPNFIS